jgi:hypothetical protein
MDFVGFHIDLSYILETIVDIYQLGSAEFIYYYIGNRSDN